MNQIEFVKCIKEDVRDSSLLSLLSILEKPPGRRPSEKLIQMSSFYHKLSEQDKIVFKNIILEGIDYAMFGFFCVLDGSRSIEDGDKEGKLVLKYTSIEEEVFINDPNQEELHDLYNGLIG